jgi:hypothetical protein
MTKSQLIGLLIHYPDDTDITVRVAYRGDAGLMKSPAMTLLTIDDEPDSACLIADGLDQHDDDEDTHA